MKLHANARLSVRGRELLVDRVENLGWSLTKAAEASGVSGQIASGWKAFAGLRLANGDRSPDLRGDLILQVIPALASDPLASALPQR